MRPRRGLLRAALTGVAAALVWGSWAFHVNGRAGSGAALRAALTQALLSFSATLGLVLVLERLFRVGRTPHQGFLIASLGTVSLASGTMATVHALAGTPRILATIGPSVSVAAVFFVTYAWGLRAAASRFGLEGIGPRHAIELAASPPPASIHRHPLGRESNDR